MKLPSRKSISENIKTRRKDTARISSQKKNELFSKRKTELLKVKKSKIVEMTCSCVNHKLWSGGKDMLQFVRKRNNLASTSSKMYTKKISNRMKEDDYLSGHYLCNPCYVYYKTNLYVKESSTRFVLWYCIGMLTNINSLEGKNLTPLRKKISSQKKDTRECFVKSKYYKPFPRTTLYITFILIWSLLHSWQGTYL